MVQNGESGLADAKRPDYFETDRTEFLDWVGGHHARVLDIGCGAGGSAAWYRSHGASEIVGVEMHGPSAKRAASRMDRVLPLPIEEAIAELSGTFDLIVCADVLEHLVDPWAIVRQLATLAGPSTVLAVSVPNIRFLPAVIRVAFGRGFVYEERGIFDATHLRFFTPRDARLLLQGGGWQVRRSGAPEPGRQRPIRKGIATLTGGRTDQWLASQTYLAARLGAHDS